MWRFAFLALAFVSSTEAHADVKDYCAAYARDFADLVKKQDPDWQPRYDNSEASCLQRFSQDVTPELKTRPKIKTAVSKKPPKVALAPVKETAPESQAIKSPAGLTPGSPAWTAYCEKKYVSFDASKGTYLSKTGIERKCLVTKDDAPVNAKAKATKTPPAKAPAKR
jgi:BA14K-like protein